MESTNSNNNTNMSYEELQIALKKTQRLAKRYRKERNAARKALVELKLHNATDEMKRSLLFY